MIDGAFIDVVSVEAFIKDDLLCTVKRILLSAEVWDTIYGGLHAMINLYLSLILTIMPPHHFLSPTPRQNLGDNTESLPRRALKRFVATQSPLNLGMTISSNLPTIF